MTICINMTVIKCFSCMQTSAPDTIRLQLWQVLSPQGQLIRSQHSTAMHIQLPWLTAHLQGLGLKLTAEIIPSSDQQQSSSTCWQPLLVAYAEGSSVCNQSVRDVVRRNPAELLLWTTETLHKQIGVISDPSCNLRLRSILAHTLWS